MTLRTLGLLTLGFCAGAASHIAFARAQSVTGIADAPLAVRDMYTVDLENEFVRVVRVRYPAHASGAMHTHPAPGALIVPLTDQDARVKGQDGSMREIHVKAGQVRWSGRDAGQGSVDVLGARRGQPRRSALRDPENRTEGRRLSIA